MIFILTVVISIWVHPEISLAGRASWRSFVTPAGCLISILALRPGGLVVHNAAASSSISLRSISCFAGTEEAKAATVATDVVFKKIEHLAASNEVSEFLHFAFQHSSIPAFCLALRPGGLVVHNAAASSSISLREISFRPSPSHNEE